MQHVLIADDSADIRKLVLNTFSAYAHKFKTFVAKNGKEATDILSKEKIDLVVTDIQMPVMDGLELIEFIDAHQPGIPIFIIATTLTPEVDKKVTSSEAMKFFQKPFSPKDLAESVLEELLKSAGGEMHGVTISSFLQLMEMDKRTCTLLVKDGANSGQLSLRKGVLVNARAGNLSGEPAACEIISWDKATVRIKGGEHHEQNVIETPLMALIIEAVRLKDERTNSGKMEHPAEAKSESMTDLVDPQADDAIERQKAKLPQNLLKILDGSDEVEEYRIFNQDDFVLFKSETSDSALKVVPSDYFRLVDPLAKQLAAGKMAHFQISIGNGKRCIFLEYQDARLLLSVKPRFHTEKLLNVLEKLRPVARATA